MEDLSFELFPALLSLLPLLAATDSKASAAGEADVGVVLRRLADQGKTIVCVIHQPRASILPVFNNVLLLGSGRQVYFGPSCNFDGETIPMR